MSNCAVFRKYSFCCSQDVKIIANCTNNALYALILRLSFRVTMKDGGGAESSQKCILKQDELILRPYFLQSNGVRTEVGATTTTSTTMWTTRSAANTTADDPVAAEASEASSTVPRPVVTTRRVAAAVVRAASRLVCTPRRPKFRRDPRWYANNDVPGTRSTSGRVRPAPNRCVTLAGHRQRVRKDDDPGSNVAAATTGPTRHRRFGPQRTCYVTNQNFSKRPLYF